MGTLDGKIALITGVGAVSPFGIGADALWAGVKAGQSGIDLITLFDQWAAAEPGQGHDAEAARWRARRAELDR